MEAIGKLRSFIFLNRFIDDYSRRIKSNSAIRQSACLAVLAACNGALALFMSWFVVSRIGVSGETDAFFASTALPQFVFILLTTTLLPVLVPIFATQNDKHFSEDVWSFFSLIAAIFIAIAIGLYLSTAAWVPMLVPGFPAAAKSLTVKLTRIQLVSMVLNAAIVTLWAAHHARHKFIWVELSGVIANVAGLSFLVVTIRHFGIWAAAFNTVFFNTVKLLFLLPILGRFARPKWRSLIVTQAWQRLKPLLPGQLYLRTDPMLDRLLTSMTGPGTLSLLYVVQQMYASIILLLGKAVIAPMAPKLAIDAREGQWSHYQRTYKTRLLALLAITFSGSICLLISKPAFRFLIGEGGITRQNVHTLWLIMIALSGTFIGGALVQVTAGAFYAMGNTRTPTKMSALIYTVYIPIKIVSFLKFGLIGLAIVMSSYFVTNCLIQFFQLHKDVLRKQVR